jgi:hypothetical protein
MADRVSGWRKVALVLASNESPRHLDSLGIAVEPKAVRAWARTLLGGVEDFWEVYDVDPDGGAAAQAIEAELATLVPEAAMDALRDGAILFARPSEGDLNDWSRAIYSLRHQDMPELTVTKTPLREDLRAVVMSHVERVERDAKPAIPWVEGEAEDEWVVAFGHRHGVWPSDLAESWIELRQTHAVIRALNETLVPADREEFEAWAQSDLYSDPRPAHWPLAPALRLADAAAPGWRHVTLSVAE